MLRSFLISLAAIAGAAIHLVLWYRGLASEFDLFVYTVLMVSVVSFTLYCED